MTGALLALVPLHFGAAFALGGAAAPAVTAPPVTAAGRGHGGEDPAPRPPRRRPPRALRVHKP